MDSSGTPCPAATPSLHVSRRLLLLLQVILLHAVLSGPKGRFIAQIKSHQEHTLVVIVDAAEAEKARSAPNPR